ncbi:MAG: integrating conjugative element protein [Cellvibrio sp. 79]|nr:MAG: integrating conjugative element protein [Cellvibrio sp. 79]
MKFTRNVLCQFTLLLLFSISNIGHAQTQIEVFTDTPTALGNVSGIEVIHYDLSIPERIKEKYLPALPGDIDRAKKIMKTYLASVQGMEFQKAIREAYRGHEKMVQYQLEKIPAVVFNQGQYVVYGITDIQRALALYKSHRNLEEAP